MIIIEDIAWLEEIKRFSAKAEEDGKLTDEMLAIAYQQQWFKLFVPKAYGGLGKKLPEILRLEEELAKADGSLGWTVTLCAGAGWFAGFLDPKLAVEIFNDRKVCFAGSGAVGGTAIATAYGFLVNGHWKHASGALHATVFTANCFMHYPDGTAVVDQEGNPKIKSFILKKEEVNILAGWSYYGLIATGSHAFEVTNVHVPENRAFEINQTIEVADEGFDYPFLQLAETTLTVNNLGMARHFIALVDDYFYNRSGLKRFSEAQIAFFENELTNCKAQISRARNHFYGAFDSSWNELMVNKMISETQLAEVSKHSRALTHTCWRVAQQLYPYCGLEAAKKDAEINRVWRDLHTASQHALLTFKS